MRRLSSECLYKSNTEDLERLAAFLGCTPARLPTEEGPRRRAVVHSIMAAEKRIEKRPLADRWKR